jgi:hypothetical protein
MMNAKISDFLAQKRIAVAGVSRNPQTEAANFIYRKLRAAGYEVFQDNNIAIISGGCPMMFCQPVDFGHKCMRWILNLTGGLPK